MLLLWCRDLLPEAEPCGEERALHGAAALCHTLAGSEHRFTRCVLLEPAGEARVARILGQRLEARFVFLGIRHARRKVDRGGSCLVFVGVGHVELAGGFS